MANSTFGPIPLVLVKWQDITSSYNGWQDLDDINKLKTALCYTPGWILREDKKNIYMVSSITKHSEDASDDSDVQVSFDTVIPKGVIESIKILKKNWT